MGRARPGADASVPLDDNLVHVAATVDGQLVSAVLDSGTGALLLDRSLTGKLGIQMGPSPGNAAGGGATAQAIFPVIVPKLDFGPIHLEQANAVAMDTQALSTSAGFPVDVLLGRPLFAARPIAVDYAARQISFFAPGSAPSCANPITFELVNGVPVVPVTLRPARDTPPITLRMIVDLGTRHFAAIIGGPFLDSGAGKALAQSGTPQQVGTGAGGPVAGILTHVDELSVADMRYPNLSIALTSHVAAFSMGFADGTLGVPLWSNGALTFDYAHRVLCLKAAP
ncbi:MAG TPA: retropepsin-like aspartic protease [Rhizomicrobium sp.]|nr:retropepsin-like aspartic protease [Rhizomicrobium sp.]